ncbi:hypothetical protein GF340_02575 [Candidatus Peregrinibacteria bacterium]|nr:hypothetical protein [Candidatus Peregrinibacteria bacterium]
MAEKATKPHEHVWDDETDHGTGETSFDITNIPDYDPELEESGKRVKIPEVIETSGVDSSDPDAVIVYYFRAKLAEAENVARNANDIETQQLAEKIKRQLKRELLENPELKAAWERVRQKEMKAIDARTESIRKLLNNNSAA